MRFVFVQTTATPDSLDALTNALGYSLTEHWMLPLLREPWVCGNSVIEWFKSILNGQICQILSGQIPWAFCLLLPREYGPIVGLATLCTQHSWV